MPCSSRSFSSKSGLFCRLCRRRTTNWREANNECVRNYSTEHGRGTIGQRKATAADTSVNWRLLESRPTYDPKYVEDKRLCQALWDRMQVARPETILSRNVDAPKLTMLLPPPNVTGSLHIGHALTCAVQDALARYHRMLGGAVLWIPGMDHAGIATQAVVERDLLKRSHRTASAPGTTPAVNPRLMLGRQAFVHEVWKWKNKQAAAIREQLDCLGLTLDWSREFFTLDPKHSRAVTEAFVRLYDAGLIYRDASIVSWCCYFQSAISDIEVENIELREATKLPVPGYSEPQTFGIMDYFAYPLADEGHSNCGERNSTEIVVGTTRLETMLADTALVVHPEDERYTHLIGRHVIHPICPKHRRLPIVADAQLVDRSKGTGVVKLSPGHSAIDWEVARRLGLPVLNMLDDAGRVTDIGGEFTGLPRFVARQQLVQRLTELGLYRGREDIAQSGQTTILPTCSRSGDIIEPVVREQWFIRTNQMAEQAVEAVRSGQLKLHPAYQNAIWFEWLSPGNHRDWCVSRQLWWGHRIPAFRVKTSDSSANSSNPWLVARTAEEAKERFIAQKPTANLDSIEMEQDPDVLDTWFSSALLPFTTLGWPDQTPDMMQFYPMQLLETGQDILFFWVARMIMLGLQLTKALPFSEVLLHGLVCDARGQKMSKSRGNVINPLDLIHGTGTLPKSLIGPNIHSIGADALRASLLCNTLGQPQVAYNQESVVEMRRFCNKIWQTGRFALLRLQEDRRGRRLQPILQSDLEVTWEGIGKTCAQMKLADLWLICRLAEVIKQIDRCWTKSTSASYPLSSASFSHNPYVLHSAVNQLHYWWTEELCSVFLELVKYREKVTPGTDCSLFLLTVLTGLHLLHPIMPHVTEILWQGLRHLMNEPENVFPSESPETCLALQRFPQPSWFSFLEDIGSDKITRTCESMSDLLHTASCVNSWRTLFCSRSSIKNASNTVHSDGADSSTLPAMCLVRSVQNDHENEVLGALTRLPIAGSNVMQQTNALQLTVGPDWLLFVDREIYDLSWTRSELQRRLEAQLKRRAEMAARLSNHTSNTTELNRAAIHKMQSMNQRIDELKNQLKVLDNNQ